MRAGASAETIAAETGWPLDRVTRYAGPPLAERAYVAERASLVEIRRDASGQSTTLSDSVDAALESMGLYPDQVQWDAWRRSDGKWVVCVAHQGLPQSAVATWTYDHAGRNLHPLDEFARRFMETGYASIEDFLGMDPAEADEPAQEAEPDQRPRLVAVDGISDRDDSVEQVPPSPVQAGLAPTGSLSRQPTVALSRDSSPAAPTGPSITSQPAASAPSAGTSRPSQPATGSGPASAARARGKGKGRRASVPSWDEILFGASKPEDR